MKAKKLVLHTLTHTLPKCRLSLLVAFNMPCVDAISCVPHWCELRFNRICHWHTIRIVSEHTYIYKITSMHTTPAIELYAMLKMVQVNENKSCSSSYYPISPRIHACTFWHDRQMPRHLPKWVWKTSIRTHPSPLLCSEERASERQNGTLLWNSFRISKSLSTEFEF